MMMTASHLSSSKIQGKNAALSLNAESGGQKYHPACEYFDSLNGGNAFADNRHVSSPVLFKELAVENLRRLNS
jgi:hypothetical protein